MTQKPFETVSFHIVKPCNMKCKFCYATFEDSHVGAQLPLNEAKNIIAKLYRGGVKKITFAGGEPLLYRHLKEVIKFTSYLGITTSIISNGSLITNDWLGEMVNHLDWIGISVDSVDNDTNGKIGRIGHRFLSIETLLQRIIHTGYRLKINTVVNSHNWQEDMSAFITQWMPDRWKVFQTLKVEGQNDKQFEQINATDDQFQDFISRHLHLNPVYENNAAMTGSYLLVDPLGRLFENSIGRHTYSHPLQGRSLEECLSEIQLDRAMFINRGGLYNW